MSLQPSTVAGRKPRLGKRWTQETPGLRGEAPRCVAACLPVVSDQIASFPAGGQRVAGAGMGSGRQRGAEGFGFSSAYDSTGLRVNHVKCYLCRLQSGETGAKDLRRQDES